MIEVDRSNKNFPAKVQNINKLICSIHNSTSFYNNPSSGVTNVSIIVQKKPNKRTKRISVPERTTEKAETVFFNKNIVELPLIFSVSQPKQSVLKENMTKFTDSMQISKNTKSQNGRFGQMNNSSFLNIASNIIIQHLKTFEKLNKGSNDKVIVPFSKDLKDNRSSQYLLLECMENESSDDSVNDYICAIDTIQSSCSGLCANTKKKCVIPKIVDASHMVYNMAPDGSCECLKNQHTNGDRSPMLLLLDDEIGSSEDSLCSSVYVQLSENFSQINSTFSIYGTETSVSMCRVPPCNGKPVHYIEETKKFAKQRETSSYQSPHRRLNCGEGQIGYLNQSPSFKLRSSTQCKPCTPNTGSTAIKKPNLVPRSYEIKSQTSKLPTAEKDHSPHRERLSPQAIVTKKLDSPKTPKYKKSCTCEMSACLNFPTKSNSCLQASLRQIQTLAPVQPLLTSESSSQMQMLERALRPSALDPQAAFNINPLTYATFSQDLVLYPCVSTQCSCEAKSSCQPVLVKTNKLQSTATSPMCLPPSPCSPVPHAHLRISKQAQPRCKVLEVGCQTFPYNDEDSISCPCKKKKGDCQIYPFNDIYETVEKCTCAKDKALDDSKTGKKKKNKKNKNHSFESPIKFPPKDVEPRTPLSIELFVPSPFPSSCSHSLFPPVHPYIRISNQEDPRCMLSKSTDVIIKVDAGCQISPYNDAYTITEPKKCQNKVCVKKRPPISGEEICFKEALRCDIKEQEKEDCRPTKIDDACICCEKEKSCNEKKDTCTCIKGKECGKKKKPCKCNKKKDGCECYKGKVKCKCYKKNKNVKCECPRCDPDCPIRTKGKKTIDNRINYTISLLPPPLKDCNECCKELQEVKKPPAPEGINIKIRGKGSGSKGLNDLFCFDVQVVDKSTMPQLTVI